MPTNKDSRYLMMLFRNYAIQEQFHEEYDEAIFAGESSRKPTIEMWDELAENDEYFKD